MAAANEDGAITDLGKQKLMQTMQPDEEAGNNSEQEGMM